ncbi:hypothetical protein ACFQS6_17925 [Xanthomonas populi]
MVKQVGGQFDLPDEVQFRQLVLLAGEAGTAGTAAQLQQSGRRASQRISFSFIGILIVGVRGKQQGILPFARCQRQSRFARFSRRARALPIQAKAGH